MKRQTGLIALTSIVAVAALATAVAPPEDGGTWTVVLETDAAGTATSGSVEALMEYVKQGSAVRVGWDLVPLKLPDKDPLPLGHWADAGFVTTWQGHVFAQIRDIHQQGPVMDAPGIFIESDPHGWVAVLGSNGTLRQAFAGERPNVRNVVTHWSVEVAR